LEKFIVMGKRHLDYLIHEYITHYNTERPHSGIGHRRPGQVRFTVDPSANKPLQVKCKTRLAGRAEALLHEGGVRRKQIEIVWRGS